MAQVPSAHMLAVGSGCTPPRTAYCWNYCRWNGCIASHTWMAHNQYGLTLLLVVCVGTGGHYPYAVLLALHQCALQEIPSDPEYRVWDRQLAVLCTAFDPVVFVWKSPCTQYLPVIFWPSPEGTQKHRTFAYPQKIRCFWIRFCLSAEKHLNFACPQKRNQPRREPYLQRKTI